jgi:hypothetical protein
MENSVLDLMGQRVVMSQTHTVYPVFPKEKKDPPSSFC